MCNKLHKDFESIPKKGIGYKVFTKPRFSGGKILQWFNQSPYSNIDDEGWVNWREQPSWDGFCIFLNKKEAERFFERSIRRVDTMLLEIQYDDGLGSFIEEGLSSDPYRIAIVKKFYCKKIYEHHTSMR